MTSELEIRLARIEQQQGYILGNQVAILAWQEKYAQRQQSDTSLIKDIRHALYLSIISALLFSLLSSLQ